MSVISPPFNIRYEICKMTVNPYNTRASYRHKLEFWKALEKRYNDQRQKWIEASSQMETAKLAAEKAREALKNIGDEKQGDKILKENEEFSDVDPNGFADPADQYYASLHADTYVKDDLISVQFLSEEEIGRRRALARRRLFWCLNFLVVMFCVAFYLFIQIFSEPDTISPARACAGCRQEVDVPLRGLLNTLFPMGSSLDEV